MVRVKDGNLRTVANLVGRNKEQEMEEMSHKGI